MQSKPAAWLTLHSSFFFVLVVIFSFYPPELTMAENIFLTWMQWVDVSENVYIFQLHFVYDYNMQLKMYIWVVLFSLYLLCAPSKSMVFFPQESNESLEDASNELILTDEEVVRFQVGEVFAHVPKEEVESRIEEMKEVTSKNLEKLEEEKESIVAQMAELKKILYGKFKDSINLEEEWYDFPCCHVTRENDLLQILVCLDIKQCV